MCKSVNILVFRPYQCCPGALNVSENETLTYFPGTVPLDLWKNMWRNTHNQLKYNITITKIEWKSV